MATDADLSDFKVMACIDKSKGWPRSSSEVPKDLIDEYMDHAEECSYHAELILLEQRETEQELRRKFRLARGLDSRGRLLEGTMLAQAIADNERRLRTWKKEGQAFNQIALYNGSRQIANCGSFFDFSKHESINELDPRAGLQIRGTSGCEEGDVLLGSYALAGVRHDGEEQVLPLKNGYTVGLRVIRLDEKTFAIGFRCVDSASMEKLSYLETSWQAFVKCGRVVQCELESRMTSFFKALTERPNIVQLITSLFLIGLMIEGVGYLRQLVSASDETALEVQTLFLYSDSDLVQMLTVEKLIDGSSLGGDTIRIAANTRQSFRARDVRRRNSPLRESQTSSNATDLFCRGRRRCDATKAKASVVAANVRH